MTRKFWRTIAQLVVTIGFLYEIGAIDTLFKTIFGVEIPDLYLDVCIGWALTVCYFGWRFYNGFYRKMDFVFDDDRRWR